ALLKHHLGILDDATQRIGDDSLNRSLSPKRSAQRRHEKEDPKFQTRSNHSKSFQKVHSGIGAIEAGSFICQECGCSTGGERRIPGFVLVAVAAAETEIRGYGECNSD